MINSKAIDRQFQPLLLNNFIVFESSDLSITANAFAKFVPNILCLCFNYVLIYWWEGDISQTDT